MEELAAAMAEFRRMHSGVSYRLYTTNADGIKENIERGVLDIGLMTEPVDTSRFDSIRLAGKERWGAIVRTDSPLAGKDFAYAEDLVDKPLLIPVREEIRYALEGWFGRSYSQLDIAVRYNLGRNVAVMVQNDVGIGIGFNLFSDYEGLKFVPMIPPLMTGSVLCWKKNQLFSPVVGSFIEFLKNRKEVRTTSWT